MMTGFDSDADVLCFDSDADVLFEASTCNRITASSTKGSMVRISIVRIPAVPVCATRFVQHVIALRRELYGISSCWRVIRGATCIGAIEAIT